MFTPKDRANKNMFIKTNTIKKKNNYVLIYNKHRD